MPRRLPIARHAGKLLTIAVFLTAVGMADSTRAQGPGRLPFSDYQGARGLSPYNALGFQGNNPTTGGTLGAVQNIIRPQQLQAAQLRQQQQQGRQLNSLQGQMRTMQRGSAQPEATIRATGHQATFMNMSHYYPQ
jgi:hypothetical protein